MFNLIISLSSLLDVFMLPSAHLDFSLICFHCALTTTSVIMLINQSFLSSLFLVILCVSAQYLQLI